MKASKEETIFYDKRTGWTRKSLYIEPHLRREIWINKEETEVSTKYHVIYSQKELTTRRIFENLEEAKEYNLICRENLNRFRLSRLVSVKRENEDQKIILEYPETLLKVVGIIDSEYMNYYDYILPHFEDNFKTVLERKILSQKEIDTLMYRYKEGLNLEETGKHLGVTKERIRQIEFKALRKLRHPSLRNILIEDNRYELINAAEREKMYNEIKEKMTYEIALEIVKEHQNGMYNFSGEKAKIEDLDLSVRSTNCLKRSGFTYVNDLLEKENLYETLTRIRNLGKKSLKEIVDKLRECGVNIDEETN